MSYQRSIQEINFGNTLPIRLDSMYRTRLTDIWIPIVLTQYNQIDTERIILTVKTNYYWNTALRNVQSGKLWSSGHATHPLFRLQCSSNDICLATAHNAYYMRRHLQIKCVVHLPGRYFAHKETLWDSHLLRFILRSSGFSVVKMCVCFC